MQWKYPQGGMAIPGNVTRSMIEWRARRIADPVERLRFLRHACAFHRERKRWYRRGAAFVTAGLVWLLAPVSTITKATSLWMQPPPSMSGETVVKPAHPSALEPSRIWLVEKKDDFEVYSNGLRIETRGWQTHSPRSYQPLDRAHPESWGGNDSLDVAPRSDPAGIVFHTTESDLAPFDALHNKSLKQLGQGILSYVRHNKSYHYLVDRFGRVYRVVEEASIANHAGHSVWADRKSVYVNLNQSFLGVAFEAQTRPQDGAETINEAQLHAGRVLTDMLRGKYHIPAENCVTHAQVSVNPDNFRIGAHTDWATHFPFADMGLPDNYATPVPSMTVFGFSYDSTFVSVSEARLWKGLLLAQEEVRQEASVKGMPLRVYRSVLHRKFRQLVVAPRARKKEENS